MTHNAKPKPKNLKPNHFRNLDPSSGFLGFGFWKWLGFRFSGFGFRVSGFRFQVSGFGIWFWDLGFGIWVLGFGFWVRVRVRVGVRVGDRVIQLKRHSNLVLVPIL